MARIIVIAVAILIGGTLAYLRISGEINAPSKIRSEMSEICATIPSYEANAAYVESLIDAHHDEAFDMYYESGTRRRASTFDDEAYLRWMLMFMSGQAEEEGHPQIAEELRLLLLDIAANESG